MSANKKTVRYVDMELDSIHSVEFKDEVCCGNNILYPNIKPRKPRRKMLKKGKNRGESMNGTYRLSGDENASRIAFNTHRELFIPTPRLLIFPVSSTIVSP